LDTKRKAIGEEINRLRKAGIIWEIKEAIWVANPILRMCIDFTSINKHCMEDHFLLPRIDQIVDSTASFEHLSFLDAYSSYN
jgi:hypothetical protein